MTKPFWQSKTLIFNALALLALLANQFGFADFKLDAEVSAGALAIINLALRLITKTAVSLGGGNESS